MSSFTSKTIRDLYEAYNSVYIDKTELFLNDLLDTVTESVNELVNKGYDLSDYSWDEIYESFLENVLEPELQEVESFITQLNESAEELTEEQIENLLEENPLLRGLSLFSRGPRVTGSGGVTIPRPPRLQPTPGTGRPLRNPRQLELPVGQDKGSFARFGDWLSSLTSKGRAQQAAKPPAPAKPPATPLASRQPSGTPQRQQGWPSIGLRNTVGRVTRALTPGPRVKDVTKGILKYGGGTAAGLGGLTSAVALPLSAVNWATGKPSGLQQASGHIQGATGDVLRWGAGALRSTGSPEAQGVYDIGTMLKKAGADTQASVERKKREQSSGTTPPPSTQRPKKLFPEGLSIENVISEGPDWKSAPKPKGVAALTLGKETKVYIPGIGWQFPATARRWARAQGYVDWNKIPNPAQPPKPKQDPGTQQQNRASTQTPPAPPASQPPASAPTPPPSSRPAPTPPPSSRPAPTPPAPPIERRMSAVTGKQEYVGTTSSGQKFERRAATGTELAAARKARDEAKKAGSSPAEAERAAVTAGIKATQKESKMIKEPYDLVLEYLFSQGHVDTLDEAHYVMLQMDSNYIQSIVEGGGPLLPGEPGKALVLDIKNLFCLENKEQSNI